MQIYRVFQNKCSHNSLLSHKNLLLTRLVSFCNDVPTRTFRCISTFVKNLIILTKMSTAKSKTPDVMEVDGDSKGDLIKQAHRRVHDVISNLIEVVDEDYLLDKVCFTKFNDVFPCFSCIFLTLAHGMKLLKSVTWLIYVVFLPVLPLFNVKILPDVATNLIVGKQRCFCRVYILNSTSFSDLHGNSAI
jgi:hypothetical protein